MSDSDDKTTAETHSAADEMDKMSDEDRGLVGRGVPHRAVLESEED